jgi:hypothetical protein
MVPLAFTIVRQQELGKVPALLSFPVVETHRMFPLRTVKGSPLEGPLELDTTMSPVLEVEVSWMDIFSYHK